MELNAYFEKVAPDEILLRGHRMGIETILFAYLEQGLTAEEIVWRYPTLTPELVHATLTYYWHKQTECDHYLEMIRQREAQRIAEQGANPSQGVRYLNALIAQKRAKEAVVG